MRSHCPWNGGEINGDMMPWKPLWWVVVMLEVIIQHSLMTWCWTDQSGKFSYHCLVAGWIIVWWSLTVCPLVCLSIYMYIIFRYFLIKFEWWIWFLRHSVCAIFQLVHQSEKVQLHGYKMKYSFARGMSSHSFVCLGTHIEMKVSWIKKSAEKENKYWWWSVYFLHSWYKLPYWI